LYIQDDRCRHVLQERREVPPPQRRDLAGYAVVITEKVQRAQNGAVAGPLADVQDRSEERIGVGAAQVGCAQRFGHGAHFAGDGGVFMR
jgi:hypothetical protein